MYTLLGANGNITSKLARLLLSQGHSVRVVGRNAGRLQTLKRAGAEIAIGDIADRSFLTQAMQGSNAVFTMLPPCYNEASPLTAYARLGESTAASIAASGVKHVVNLSSIGAHLSKGTGPIVALHEQESRLNAIPDLSVVHLRPGEFIENHVKAIPIIQALGFYSDMLPPNVETPFVTTEGVAQVAARELTASQVKGQKRVLHLLAREMYSLATLTAAMGVAIGKPDLKYLQGEPSQVKAGMIQGGVSPAMADLLAEMLVAASRPEFAIEMQKGPTEFTACRVEQFMPMFKAAYESVRFEGEAAKVNAA